MLSILADIQAPRLRAKFLAQSQISKITASGVDIDQNLIYDMAKISTEEEEEEEEEVNELEETKT